MRVLLIIAGLFGLALGPTIVASLIDFVFGDFMALRYSLSVLSLVLFPMAALLAFQALKPCRPVVVPCSTAALRLEAERAGGTKFAS